MPNNNDCEALIGGSWKLVSIQAAKKHGKVLVRCPECKAAVKLYAKGKLRAHAEHKKRFPGCSRGDCFDGVRRDNPDAIDGPMPFALPEEVLDPKKYQEGATITISVNRYERDHNARMACLNYHGYSCSVCSLEFESRYGSKAKKIMHVHHLTSLSKVGAAHLVDPKSDLLPVCPNCHAVIHSRQIPYSIEEVRKMLSQ